MLKGSMEESLARLKKEDTKRYADIDEMVLAKQPVKR